MHAPAGDGPQCTECGYEREVCKAKYEKRLGQMMTWGIDPATPVAVTCADFYLLEWMAARYGYQPAAQYMRGWEPRTARNFANYLSIIIGGEARHIWYELQSEESNVVCPDSLTEYVKAAGGLDRAQAWDLWHRLGPHDIQVYKDIRDTFADPGWFNRGAGGEKWATVVDVYISYRKGIIKDRLFIDRCFTLEHNNAIVFDKMFSVKGLPEILEQQAAGNYHYLYRKASEPVRELWQDWNAEQRSDYDSLWLGREPW